MFSQKTLLTALFSGIVMACFAQKPLTDTVANGPSKKEIDRIFTKVDKPANFPGGPSEWMRYLYKNLRYPDKAVRKRIQGIVRVQFIVDREGNISEVVALNDPGGGLAEESVRIIKNGPKWNPAEHNGQKVIFRHIQAITFKLE